MWNIGDEFGSIDDVDILDIAQLSLNELEMEIDVFTNDGRVGGEGGTSGEHEDEFETSG